MAVIWVIEEGRLAHLLDCWPLLRVIRQEAHNQLFKGTTQLGSVDGLEVVVVTTLANHIVVLVSQNFRAVRELTLDYDEQKHAHGEDVDFRPLVDELLEDFGSDVTWRAHSSCHLLQVTSITEAKIDQLKGQVAINEDIL